MEKKESKSLDVVNVEDATAKVSDVVVVGNGDMFQLLCKASSKNQGWMKSAKACEIPGLGCLVQVTTQQGDQVAEALTFVPGVRVAPDVNGGRKLISAAVDPASSGPDFVVPHTRTESFAKELLAGEIPKEEALLFDEARQILYNAVRESMLEGKKTVNIALDTRFSPVIFRVVAHVFYGGWNVRITQTYAKHLTGEKTGSLSVEAEWSAA